MDAKSLKTLLKILRSNGVLSYTTPELTLQFSPDALLLPKQQDQHEEIEADDTDPWAQFPDGVLTNDQLAFFANGGKPGEDPFGDN